MWDRKIRKEHCLRSTHCPSARDQASNGWSQRRNSVNRTKALLIGLILMMALAVSERFWMTSPAAQAQTAAPRAFITKRSGTFNGQQAHYVATVGETILKDEAGAATASLFSTSYVREG